MCCLIVGLASNLEISMDRQRPPLSWFLSRGAQWEICRTAHEGGVRDKIKDVLLKLLPGKADLSKIGNEGNCNE